MLTGTGTGLAGSGAAAAGSVAVLIAAGVTSLPGDRRMARRICVLLRVVLLNDLRNCFLKQTLAGTADISAADTPGHRYALRV
jgi:hypothetical protein